MKRIVVSLFIFLIIIIIVLICSTRIGKIDNVSIDYGSSIKFSELEIKSAVETVKAKFKSFHGCVLTKLWYDENSSDIYGKNYLLGNEKLFNEVGEDNILIIHSDFIADKGADYGSADQSISHKNWVWILIRNNNDSNWELLTYGPKT